MSVYQDFREGILPGNYALTKSMELTKAKSSGTLWYTKKFLVLYYYVFLSDAITTQEYVQSVTESFDLFIESLDESVQESAHAFFYPENESADFKSENFRTFSAFSARTGFRDQAERRVHYQNAKRMYFAMLMGSGG